jgi:hypothetical protein
MWDFNVDLEKKRRRTNCEMPLLELLIAAKNTSNFHRKTFQ